jgi:5-methylcytosine-specific restriction enzyme A
MQQRLTMPKLRSLPSLVRVGDTRTVKLLPIRDDIYNSPEFRAWRAMVVGRAGGRCEALVNGYRCTRATPDHRMYADHIVELRDGGSLTDPSNGQCLCKSHHEIKTAAARKRRLQRPLGGTI